MKKVRNCLALAFVAVLAGCGGGGKNNSSTTPAPTGNPITVGGPVSSPTVVTLSPGQAASAVNISVPAPVASPAENVEVLGVNPLGCPSGSCSASNTGGAISLGNPVGTVIVFGHGLNANMSISFSGPQDITISNVMGVTSVAQNGQPSLPGIQFDVAVLPNAALGARTLVLQGPNNDITTFTGGLEVVP
jgi:hypothetical protein